MVRYWAVALLALGPLTAEVAHAGGKDKIKEKPITLAGTLTKDDPRDAKRNAAHKVHVVKLKKGTAYQIDMVSKQFDSYLRLEDSKGKELAEDDDGGGMLNARIIFNCQRDGDYKVIATSFNPDGVGMYTLTVKAQGQAAVVTSAHTTLIDKAAPDFGGDFAVNGKAVKLSELKGKVVLLEFCNVRDLPSIASFPKLRDWYKAHKAAGLEIVGVTIYNGDIGQYFTLDRETGKLKRLAKGGKDTEQQLLKDFAVYYKLEHRLMAVPLADALKAFDAYAVNGLPQFVLIDRQGIVRSVRLGESEATLTAVESDLKITSSSGFVERKVG